MNEHTGYHEGFHEYKDGKGFNPECLVCQADEGIEELKALADDRGFKKFQLEKVLGIRTCWSFECCDCGYKFKAMCPWPGYRLSSSCARCGRHNTIVRIYDEQDKD